MPLRTGRFSLRPLASSRRERQRKEGALGTNRSFACSCESSCCCCCSVSFSHPCLSLSTFIPAPSAVAVRNQLCSASDFTTNHCRLVVTRPCPFVLDRHIQQGSAHVGYSSNLGTLQHRQRLARVAVQPLVKSSLFLFWIPAVSHRLLLRILVWKHISAQHVELIFISIGLRPPWPSDRTLEPSQTLCPGIYRLGLWEPSV